MAKTYIVHYGELGLKGHNRASFERQLVRNIRRSLADIDAPRVTRFYGHIVITLSNETIAPEAEKRLSHIPGIAYFAPAIVTSLDIAAIGKAAITLAHQYLSPEKSFRIKATRGNKQFPLTSPEIEREVGARVVEAVRAPVNLTMPDVTIAVQIYRDGAYLFSERIHGIGGLPVGSSGRVIVLLSGGIDSPVAAHLMLRRGCTMDFIHFHLLRGQSRIRSAKIVSMARQVLSPHRISARLFMVSAAPFETAMATLESRVATVVFRRFIMRVAERLAERRQALALITGESVGQVASQTLENIRLIAQATKLPILRPLIARDKLEIINIAKEIGTYELSIQPYQDPCSLHARNPATRARLDDVREVERKIDVDSLLEETLARYVEEIRIEFGNPQD